MADDEKRLKARDLNELIRYTMWSVFRVSDRAMLDGDGDRETVAAELAGVLDQAAGKGIVTRGCYDLQGMRADADYMLWWVAPTSDELQEMYARFRRTRLGRARVTSPRSSPGKSRGITSACTRSSAPTSGTSWTPPSGGGCSPSTA